MGMTIDKAVEVLEYLKTQNPQLLSLDVAIHTMRKYQKIEKLIDSWELGLIDNIGYEISEVLEDGKID